MPSFRIPEPDLPEHQLLRDSGRLPDLSHGLRERVIVDCRRQVRYGRLADRLRMVGTVLAASVVVALVWHFRWTGSVEPTRVTPNMADKGSPSSTWSSTDSAAVPAPTIDPSLPKGGRSLRPEVKEMQQINQLIEDLRERNNVLCSFLPVL